MPMPLAKLLYIGSLETQQRAQSYDDYKQALQNRSFRCPSILILCFGDWRDNRILSYSEMLAETELDSSQWTASNQHQHRHLIKITAQG